MNERVILGTAQFGTDYGISNSTGNLLIDEAKKIVRFAKKSNIKFIDSAINYSQSNAILKEINIKNLKVISKLPSFKQNFQSNENEIEKIIQESIHDLGITNYFALLLHRPEQLLTENKDKIVKFLDLIKKKNYVQKIGISIYDPQILPKILDLYPFDIVQAPLNILDQRIMNDGHLEILKKKKIIFHARSVFLQGLLLLPQNSIPSKFNEFKKIFDVWYNWLDEHSISPLEACIRYLSQIKDVDNIIVGVQSCKQLEEILKIDNSVVTDLPKWPLDIGSKIINPSLWN